MRLRARPLIPGEGEAEAVVVDALSFYGETNPEKGTLRDGRSIAGKVLVIGRVRGSTVGSYAIYGLKYYGKKPAAIVIEEDTDPIVLVGALIAGIPLYDRATGILEAAKDGVRVRFTREGELILS